AVSAALDMICMPRAPTRPDRSPPPLMAAVVGVAGWRSIGRCVEAGLVIGAVTGDVGVTGAVKLEGSGDVGVTVAGADAASGCAGGAGAALMSVTGGWEVSVGAVAVAPVWSGSEGVWSGPPPPGLFA